MMDMNPRWLPAPRFSATHDAEFRAFLCSSWFVVYSSSSLLLDTSSSSCKKANLFLAVTTSINRTMYILAFDLFQNYL